MQDPDDGTGGGERRVTHAGPDAILFDVDGTLIDTYRLYVESYRRALAPYLGYAPTEAEMLERHPSSELRFLRDWVGAEHADACHAALCRHYGELHATLAEGAYEGVREMLSHLRSAGYPLGVVTGKGRVAWETSSEHLGLGDFAAVVTDADVEHPKPHPEGLRLATGALGLPPRAVLYVGDTLDDLAAGRAAGTRVAAALWPKTAPGERERFLEEIRAYSPDWIFERPGEVSRALAPWC